MTFDYCLPHDVAQSPSKVVISLEKCITSTPIAGIGNNEYGCTEIPAFNIEGNMDDDHCQEITYKTIPDKWTNQLEKEFVRMAKKFATDSLSQEEMINYTDLKSQRRQLHHPRSGDEVINSYIQNKLLQEITNSLYEYIKIVNVPTN